MDNGQKTMRIKTRLFLVSGIFLVLTCAVVFVLVNYSMKHQALVEAEAKIKIMADQYFAIHTYFTKQLKPALFEFTKPIRSDEYFDPTWMSSTYAIREIVEYIRLPKGDEYYLRDAAINARSPENEASPLEKDFISALNADPNLKTKTSVEIIDGRPFFVFLRRGELMETPCLRCHSSPDQAPKNLIHSFGTERSFNRKLGDWPSAISIRVPLSATYANANRFSLKLSGFLLTIFLAFFGILYWLNNRLVFNPLSILHEKAINISHSKELLGEKIPLPSGRELKELTAAFNKMSSRLRYHMDHLEEHVKDRTAELFKTNEALQAEKAFAEALINTAQALILVLDKEGRILRFNPYMEEITGYNIEEVQGKDWFSTFLPIRDHGRIRDFFLNSLSNIQIRGNVNPILTKDGHEIEIEWYDKTLKDDQNNVIGLIAIGQDITERKRVEKALKESEEKYRTIMGTLQDSVYICSMDFRIEYMNPAMIIRTGRDATGQICYKALHGRDEKCSWCVLDTIQNGKTIEYERADLDGTRYYKVINSPISYGRGVSKLSLLRDITRQKLSQKALKKSAENLRALGLKLTQIEEAEKKKLALELHDRIGQNLTALNINLNIIENRMPPDLTDKMGGRVSDSIALTDRIFQLIRDVMADLRPETLDDYGLMAALGLYCENFEARYHIRTQINGCEFTPRLALEMETAVFRIVQEAMTNVIRHAQANTITLTFETSDPFDRITIADNGAGFDPEALEAPGKSSGWGLTIMQERALAMGMQFLIESSKGNGTKIIVEIKRTREKR